MELTILYFARLRESVGHAREHVSLPGSVTTLGELRAWLTARGDPWSSAFVDVHPVRAAIDQQVENNEDAPLREGAEVAFFPPVTGG